jgi:hypothetical protein
VGSEEMQAGCGESARPAASDEAVSLPTAHSPLLTHRIRLGPPWQVTATEGGTRHARKFGRPRALDGAERLWLVCDSLPAATQVFVNGTAVGALDAPGPFAADITPLLQPRNEVVFALASDSLPGATILEVRSA